MMDAIDAFAAAIAELHELRIAQIAAADAVHMKELHLDQVRHRVLFGLLETGTNENRRKLERDQALYEHAEYQDLLLDWHGAKNVFALASAEVEHQERVCRLKDWLVRAVAPAGETR